MMAKCHDWSGLAAVIIAAPVHSLAATVTVALPLSLFLFLPRAL